MPQSHIPCRVRSLDHLVLTVRDIAETVHFYRDVLGMEALQFEVADGTRRWALSFGDSKINLHQSGREFSPKAAHPLPGSADLCFLVDTPIDGWLAHLDACGVALEEGPVRRSGATGPIMSLYVRDPDCNLIELSLPVA